MNSKFKGFIQYFLLFLVLALLISLVYARTFHAPLVLDDIRTIVDNPVIHDLSNFSHLQTWAKPRPVAEFSFALNYALGGADPLGYHLLNTLIHVLNSFLVYLLAFFVLSRLASRPYGQDREAQVRNLFWIRAGAFFCALVFALHPLQTMAVTYIAQRYSSLAALFSLACIVFYILGRLGQESLRSKSYQKGFFILAFFAALLAFLSKQSAVVLPGLVLLVEFLLFSRSRAQFKKMAVILAPAIMAFALFVLYSAGVFGPDWSLGRLLADISQRSAETQEVSRWIYLCTQFGVIVQYLWLTVLPVGQNIDHMYPFVSGFWEGWTPFYFLLLLSLLAIAVFSWRWLPVLALGIGWLFIALSVESGVIPIRDAMFEHRMYLPMFGPALLAGYLCYYAGSSLRRPALVAAGLVLVLVLLSSATLARNELWRDPVALWTDSVQKNPENDRAWNNLGQARLEQGSLEQAAEHLQRALEINSDNPRAKGNLGYIYFRQGRPDKALPLLEQAAKALPRSADFQYNLGVALGAQGKSRQAVKQYKAVLQLRPEYQQARMNLGVELARMGRLQEAAGHLQQVVEQDKDNFDVLRNLGMIRLQLKELEEARDLMQRALEIRPKDPQVLTYLGITHYSQGNYAQAMDHLVHALNIKPNNQLARQYVQHVLQGLQEHGRKSLPLNQE